MGSWSFGMIGSRQLVVSTEIPAGSARGVPVREWTRFIPSGQGHPRKDGESAFSIAVIVSETPEGNAMPRWMQCRFGHPVKGPDLARMLSAIQKGGVGVIWESEKQVCEVFGLRTHSETPGVKIMVFRFEGEHTGGNHEA